MDDKNASEELAYYHNSTGVIAHACDENGINLFNTEEEAVFTSIQSNNGTNGIYINDDENVIHKYYAPVFQSKIMKMYVPDHNIIQCNEDYVV